MREKPENTFISSDAFLRFEDLCEQEGISEHPDDWMPWFIFYEAGYVNRMEE